MSEVTRRLDGRRILLVEDEYLIAQVMEDWLRGAGASVVGPVSSVGQALGMVEEHAGSLDGAVLDVNLGRGETAYPIADKLNELGVPYMFATGDVRIIDDPAHRQRPRLDKPIARTQLLRALAGMLADRPPGAG